MWTSSSMDTSLNSGGGFLDTTQPQDVTKGKAERLQNVVPLTIADLLAAPDVNELKLGNLPIRTFMIIALVRNIEETATKMTYNVEDQTGSITALKWIEAEKKGSIPLARVNAYFHIFGFLREQNDKKHILILRMYPVKDLSTLMTHLLELAYVLKSSEEIFISNSPKNSNSKDAIGSAVNEDSNLYGMDNDQISVYETIKMYNDTNAGIERNDLIAQLPRTIKINEILEFLISEGHIYTTSTDDHFKTT